MALHVVSMPAMQEQHDRAAHVLLGQLFPAQLDVEHVRREVVARLGAVGVDLGVDVVVELVESGLADLRRRG